MTAQGVRDLNHTGPKKKPTPVDGPVDAPVGTIEDAPPVVVQSAAVIDDPAATEMVPNG